MRELEMRMRVFRFLKARLRNTLMPATVGIGLAVGGCAKEGLTSTPDSSAPPAADASKVVEVFPLYGVPVPPDAPVADSSVGEDQSLVGDGASDVAAIDVAGRDASGSIDTGRDLGMITKYIAPIPDASGSIDTGRDLGMITKYIAPIPDASPDKPVIAPVYAAMGPTDARGDTGLVAPRYGAQPPNAS